MMYATVLGGIGGNFFWFLFTLYLGELNYSPGTIGIILMIMGFTSTLPLLPAGYLGDRFGRKRMILIGLVMSVISPIVVVFTDGFLSLCAGAVLWGFGSSFYGPSFLALMAEKVSDRKRKYLFSLQSFVGMISGAFTLLFAGFMPGWMASLTHMALTDGYRITFLLGAIVLALEVPFLLLLKEERKEPLTLRALSKRKETVGKEPSPIPWKTLFMLCLPMVLIGIGAGLIVPFFQLYFIWRFNTPVDIIGILFAITQFFWGAAYLIMPYFSDSIGSVRAITIVQAFAIFALLGIPLSPTFHFVAVMYVIRMVAMNAAWPILQSYSIGQVPKEHSSFTLSATNFCFNVPKGLTPGIAGYIYEYNLELPFFICAAFYLVSTILFFLVFKDRDDKGAPFGHEEDKGPEEE